ncbi:MAG TPA: glycosyltransferase [Desulfohalobiaceae bacterium]|nr:glycosyltransferase [Desulfohalobiaceae bacterium]
MIIVNYKSASLTVQAAYSVLESESIGPIQVVVVDNSEDSYEVSLLKSNLPYKSKLQINTENIGFGKACNLVFNQYESDLVLLLNPDAKLLPNSLVRLQDCLLKSSRIAAVGPKIFWDDGCRFLLPPSLPNWLLWYCSYLDKGGMFSLLGKQLRKYWRKYTVKVWQAQQPIRVSNLSGGHVLLNSSAVQKSGGLFDPLFFLYFEDTDLFSRLRQAGFELFIEPKAKVVHWYNQCGHGEDQAHKRALMDSSARLFWDKHGYQDKIQYKIMTKLASLYYDKPAVYPEIEFFSPFALPVPERYQQEWLFEWSPNFHFIPASGRICSGPTMEFPEECWNILAPGRYFGRLGSLYSFDGQEQLISWTIKAN